MQALLKFLFEGLAVRGMHVRLEDDWRALLARRAAGAADDEFRFALPVRRLLGEMAAASCLMQCERRREPVEFRPV